MGRMQAVPVRALLRGHRYWHHNAMERLRLVDDGVSIRKDKYQWSCEFREDGANGFFHGGSKADVAFFTG